MAFNLGLVLLKFLFLFERAFYEKACFSFFLVSTKWLNFLIKIIYRVSQLFLLSFFNNKIALYYNRILVYDI